MESQRTTLIVCRAIYFASQRHAAAGEATQSLAQVGSHLCPPFRCGVKLALRGDRDRSPGLTGLRHCPVPRRSQGPGWAYCRPIHFGIRHQITTQGFVALGIAALRGRGIYVYDEHFLQDPMFLIFARLINKLAFSSVQVTRTRCSIFRGSPAPAPAPRGLYKATGRSRL
jgi:hypothetical protein